MTHIDLQERRAAGIGRLATGIAASIALGMALASCATWPSGPLYPDHPAARTAVPPDRARLVVYRVEPQSKWMARAGPTRLQLDGTDVGTLWASEFDVRDVPPGRHVLGVDNPATPGACELPIDAAGGEAYFFQVDTRESYAWAMLPGQVLSSVPLVGIAAGPVAWVAGGSIESAGKTCGGPDSIVNVDRDTAIARLANMRSEK